MSPREIIIYLVTWGIIGAVFFSIFVIFVFRTGVVYTARNEDGLLKEEIPFRGYLTSGIFVLCIIGFLVLANYLGLTRQNIRLSLVPSTRLIWFFTWSCSSLIPSLSMVWFWDTGDRLFCSSLRRWVGSRWRCTSSNLSRWAASSIWSLPWSALQLPISS